MTEAGASQPPAAGGDAAGGEAIRRVAITGVAIGASGADADDEADDAPGDDGWDDDLPERRDWAWVEEWRASGEPPAWAPGVTVAIFIALLVAVAILVLSKGLADIPWLAVTANVLVAAGLAPALWLSRHLPVLRWIAAGAALGVVVGWIGALIS